MNGAPSRPAIEVFGLAKRFGAAAAVEGLTFSCARGEVFGFVGPDGAGKTTIMRLLAAVMSPDEGSIVIEGVDAVADAEARPLARELYAAAVRPLRRPDGRREHRVLRRPLRHSSQGARRARRAPSRRLRHDAVPQAPGGPALRRDEAEARPHLLAHPHAERAAARRANRRRRSGVAARLLAHPLRSARGGRRDRGRHVLPRRGRAVHAARPPARGPHALLRHAGGAESADAGRDSRGRFAGGPRRARRGRRAGRREGARSCSATASTSWSTTRPDASAISGTRSSRRAFRSTRSSASRRRSRICSSRC